MKLKLSILLAATLAASAFGQGRGGGAGAGGGVVGGVTGTVNGVGRGVTGTVNSTVNGAANANVARPPANAKGAPNPGPGPFAGLNANQQAALSTHLQTLLPPTMTPSEAALGFRNQGQFVAAVHAAHNLNLPFEQLKAEMTGTNQASLGQAIQKLRPALSSGEVKNNVRLAERQAERDARQAANAGKPDRVATAVTSNTRLAARLTPLLPEGMALADAAAGFKNQGQFIAAVQASKNLGISFADLKDRMTAGQSLGQAIQELQPATEASAKASAKVAEEQARQMEAEASVEARADSSAQR
jgi:hypothetical protein